MTYKCPDCGHGINFNHQGCKIKMNLTKLIELQAGATPGDFIDDGDNVYDSKHYNDLLTSTCCCGSGRFKNEEDAKLFAATKNFDFAALDEKIKRYEDALRFYADGKNYGAVPVCCGNGNIHGCCGNYQPDYEIMNDVGNRAKQALEGME